MNLVVLGLIFDIIGVFILTLNAIIDYPHQRIYNQKERWKKYWWEGWRPIYRNTQTRELKIKLNSMVIRYGILPPKSQWNIIGFLYIGVGFLFQILGNLRG
tara:strand:+ start:1700 stop:2002 length:303 start_codon:yes stop_codon:yes gene_type:complete